jgi:2-dehydro-3-deoxygluconokinase
VGYVTALGADKFGDDFVALWKREGIDTNQLIRRDDAPTAVYFISHGEDGHRFSYLRDGSAASRYGADDVPEDYIAGAKVLHVSGISQAISASACDAVFRAIEVARANDVAVSYDINLRPALWPIARARAVIHATAAQATFLLTNRDEGAALTGLRNAEEIAAFYRALGAGVVVVKDGDKGALVMAEGVCEMLPGYRVATIDATGAGDTFDGAFLAEMVSGADAVAAARHANAAAALSTTGYGAVTPIPDREAVLVFLTAART